MEMLFAVIIHRNIYDYEVIPIHEIPQIMLDFPGRSGHINVVTGELVWVLCVGTDALQLVCSKGEFRTTLVCHSLKKTSKLEYLITLSSADEDAISIQNPSLSSFVEHKDENTLVHNDIFENVIECDSDQNIPSQASKISLPLGKMMTKLTAHYNVSETAITFLTKELLAIKTL
ncbi:hypothetical protein OUZ56_023926 [Daphnia magna]|uniref:Uncharacterized protein n=1 Tax=Daphnia magna TaxID=35525 RepID=A0ABR0AZU4_9CRUS|nr:hypothetical protein OUZ56_023926 [Daphnia magna]